MPNLRSSFFFAALALLLLTACDHIENKIFGEPVYGYKSCLLDSFKGGHHYTAADTRSLCEEITASNEPSYTYTESGLVPNNDYTKCYDKEKKSLEKEGNKKAADLAKALCKYAPK